jgi:GTP-binding protein
VDAKDGLVPSDQEVAERLHTLGKPVVMAVNKTDVRKAQEQAGEFHQLGIEPVIEVAAEHGDGVADLLDEIVRLLPGRADDPEADPGPDETAVAIVGRPNVGKSSLVNRLLREERVMVSDMPGTTRDTIDVVLQWEKRRFRILDTAGMRRPGKVFGAGQVEAVSVVLARRAMSRADVAVLVVDATEGAGDREGGIAGEAVDSGCGIVIAVNKWDLVKGQGQEWVKAFDDKLRFQLKFLEFAPIVHLSALTGERTAKVLEAVDRVATARRTRVTTGQLNRFLEEVTTAHPPSGQDQREVRIMYAAQTGINPPAFVLFTNIATKLHFSYERFIVNKLRESFGFEGTPIRLKVRKRPRK